MTNRAKRTVSFRPSTIEAQLEERVVLSSAHLALPAPAPAPFFSSEPIGNPVHVRTLKQLRIAHARQAALSIVTARDSVSLNLILSVPNIAAGTSTLVSRQVSVVPTANTRLTPIFAELPSNSGSTGVVIPSSSALPAGGSKNSSEPTGSSGLGISLGLSGTAGGVAFQSRSMIDHESIAQPPSTSEPTVSGGHGISLGISGTAGGVEFQSR